jgi:hypothetical protein
VTCKVIYRRRGAKRDNRKASKGAIPAGGKGLGGRIAERPGSPTGLQETNVVKSMFDDYVLKDAGGPLPNY